MQSTVQFVSLYHMRWHCLLRTLISREHEHRLHSLPQIGTMSTAEIPKRKDIKRIMSVAFKRIFQRPKVSGSVA
jgi:hypothetical protein